MHEKSVEMIKVLLSLLILFKDVVNAEGCKDGLNENRNLMLDKRVKSLLVWIE